MKNENNEIKQNDNHLHINEINDNQKKNFKSRLIVGILIVLILFPCILLGGWFWFALVLFMLVISTHELINTPKKGKYKFKWLIYIFSYIMMISLTFWMFFKNNLMDFYNYFHEFHTFDGFDFSLEKSFPQPSLSVCCFAVNIGFFFLIVLIDKDFSISDAFYFITMFFVTSLGMQCFLYLRYVPFTVVNTDITTTLNSNVNLFKYLGSSLLIILVIISAFGNDIGAYVVGVLFGKHKMTSISPKKTWEGFFGGIIFSFILTSLYGIIFSACGIPILEGVLDLEHWYNILILAIFNPLVGTMGDLLFSSIKRHFEIKDFGTILKSHGGVLDRIDSLILVSISTALFVLVMINKWNLFI